MNELAYIMDKWDLMDVNSPILIPNKTRVDLAQMFAELEYKKGAEIGTLKGNYAFTLAKSNRSAELYCVDPWKVYDGYGDNTNQDQLEGNHRKAFELLKPFNNVHFVYEFSMDALAQFDDGSLDYVYIDANHEWAYITQDIYYWEKKVRPGGIVSGHDYLFEHRRRCHVKWAVDGYTEAFSIDPWFLVGKSGRALSWFWVKQ